jgi:YfiH family protein
VPNSTSTKQQSFVIGSFPSNVQLISTTRFTEGGASELGYGNFNLATHVGDDVKAVAHNRTLLIERFDLPSEPKYLQQIHSNICLQASSAECLGDAVVTKNKGVVCAVMTADCLPIFACDTLGTQVGVAHAGWKGMVNGVIESLIDQFESSDLLVHFGPAISQVAFEVGEEVYQQFIDKDAKLAQAFIVKGNKYQLDIYQAARVVLSGLGVKSISGGDECTYTQQDKYFSYRRDGTNSGRMISLIYLK